MDPMQAKEESINKRSLLDVLENHAQLQSMIIDLMQSVQNASTEDLMVANFKLKDAIDALGHSQREEVSPPLNLVIQGLEDFARRFSFDVSADGTVYLAPSHSSFIEVIEEAQRLSQQLKGINAVSPETLKLWQKDERFLRVPEVEDSLLSFSPLVLKTGNKDRSEQESFLSKRNMTLLSLPELAVLHVAYSVIKGEDLFQGYVLRAQESALCLSVDGLAESDPGDWVRDEDILAAAKNAAAKY
jgi:hypothetical protein